MSIALHLLDSMKSLADHQAVIRQQEARFFALLSLGCGVADGRNAPLVVFDDSVTEAPTPPVTLVEIDGSLGRLAQEAAVNTMAGEFVCYGSLYVHGAIRNVVAVRRT